MFGSIGGPELIVIFVVALLIFGPRKLPELGRMLGKGMSEFRRAASDLKDSLEVEVSRESSAGGRSGQGPSTAPTMPPADTIAVLPDPAAPPVSPSDLPEAAAPSLPDDSGSEPPR